MEKSENLWFCSGLRKIKFYGGHRPISIPYKKLLCIIALQFLFFVFLHSFNLPQPLSSSPPHLLLTPGLSSLLTPNLFPPNFPIQTLSLHGPSIFLLCKAREDLLHGTTESRGNLASPFQYQLQASNKNNTPTFCELDRRLPSKRRKRSPDFQLDCKGTRQ